MKNAPKFLAQVEKLLEHKTSEFLKTLLEETEAARKADDADPAQVGDEGGVPSDGEITTEEDAAQLDPSHLDTSKRDGNDVVTTENDEEFLDFDDEELAAESEEEELEDFLDESDDDFEEQYPGRGGQDTDARLESRRAKRKK